MAEQPVTILLVENNPADARLLQALLAAAEGDAYRVEHVDRLADAIARLAEGRIGAVLLDLSLPDSGGLDTLRRLLRHAPDVPVIVLTAIDDAVWAAAAHRAGAQDYLPKGRVTGGQLARALRHAIERSQVLSELRAQALLDPLTGLYNRRGFSMLADQQLYAANRGQRPCLVVFLDVDRLKAINDTHGHHTGDCALRAVADMLRATFRQTDTLARLGGDEFAVLAVDAAPESAARLIERLEHNLAARSGCLPPGVALSLSIGVASNTPGSAASLEALLGAADRRMYAVKHHKQGAR